MCNPYLELFDEEPEEDHIPTVALRVVHSTPWHDREEREYWLEESSALG